MSRNCKSISGCDYEVDTNQTWSFEKTDEGYVITTGRRLNLTLLSLAAMRRR